MSVSVNSSQDLHLIFLYMPIVKADLLYYDAEDELGSDVSF